MFENNRLLYCPHFGRFPWWIWVKPYISRIYIAVTSFMPNFKSLCLIVRLATVPRVGSQKVRWDPCYSPTFNICWHQIARNALKLSTMVGESLKFVRLKWLNMHLNYPPWLEKILKFVRLKWLNMYLNYPTWLEKILKFVRLKWLNMT